MIARRAVDCKSYARALFYWEQHIREQRSNSADGGGKQDMEPLYERLQKIYTQIDEPDGIEGISSHLQVLDIEQQILEHRKAGRWTAAQSWYELLLTQRPQDPEVQYHLLTCLKESGQHGKCLRMNPRLSSAHANPRRCITQPDRRLQRVSCNVDASSTVRLRSFLGHQQMEQARRVSSPCSGELEG